MFAKSTLTSSTVSCWHSRHIAVLQKLVGNEGIATSGKPIAGRPQMGSCLKFSSV